MKALVYTGPEAMEYLEVPDPTPPEGQVLVRIDRVGICGSDMHAFLGHDERRPAPLILGHEAAGHIVGGDRDGERVTVNPLLTCGTCPACARGDDNLCPERKIISMPPREGAFARYICAPPERLVTVPDGVPFAKAALAEPLSCSWHAVRLALNIVAEGRALVIGGGAIGLGAALSLRAQGVSDTLIVEPNDTRRAFLESIGEAVTDAAPDMPFDIVVDGVGYAATREVASASVRPGGVIAHIGLGSGEGGLDIRRMTLQEVTFIGTYTFTQRDFRDTAAAIFDGRLGNLDWTEERPLADGATAFADIRAGRTPTPKILLVPEE